MPTCYVKSGSTMTPKQNFTAEQCFNANTNHYYVLSASEWDTFVTVDPGTAGYMWGFGLATVVGCWIIALKVGLILQAMRR